MLEKKILTIINVFAIPFMLWLSASYIEILANNLSGKTLSFWNIFQIIL